MTREQLFQKEIDVVSNRNSNEWQRWFDAGEDESLIDTILDRQCAQLEKVYTKYGFEYK